LRFELIGGRHTEVLFYRDGGRTAPFPSDNADLIMAEGTEESRELLERILESGVGAVPDRVYLAYMGPPIPPYEVHCYCGHIIRFGHDEHGYYVEGAPEVVFRPRGADESGRSEGESKKD